MKIITIKEILNAEIYCCENKVDRHVYSAFGSDMMSDVLAFVNDQAVLLTGLVNPQVIRTAEMMDMKCIVFVRSKKPTDEMIALAEESGIILMSTNYRMYDSCGLLYQGGLVGKQVQNG